MKRDIKINVSVLWAVYYKITAYRDALTDMETASSHFLSVLESQDSATYERLAEVWKQNVQVQESVLKDRLNSIAQVLSDYIYDMEACIMPKDESQMMRVDRNDIWWNYDQIEGNVEDLEDILDDTGSSWKDYDDHYWYNPFLSKEENDDRKKAQEDEEARESGRRQRNYNKLAGFRSTLSSKLSNELSTYVSRIKKIHEENVIDFENTDDSYKTKMDDLYSDWASFWDRVTDVWDVVVDVVRGVWDAAVDLVVGILDLAVGVLKVVAWLSLKGSVFDTFGLIPEKLEADVQGIFSGIKTIFKDPKGVLEAMGQSIADTVDEEGIAYSISYVTSDIVIGILVDKGIGKLKSLNKVDDIANVATDAGKGADDIAGVAGKSSDEMAEVAGGTVKTSDEIAGIVGKNSDEMSEIAGDTGKISDDVVEGADDVPVGMVDDGGLDVRVKPSGEPDILAKPGGKRTVVNYADPDTDNVRALTRENEAADTLARQGYTVEQNPNVPGNKNPDYLIEGEIFDCYSPKDGTKVRNIASGIKRKIDEGQTNRIILNLDDWHGGGGNIDDLIKQLKEWPIEGLEEVKIINQYHEVIDIYP